MEVLHTYVSSFSQLLKFPIQSCPKTFHNADYLLPCTGSDQISAHFATRSWASLQGETIPSPSYYLEIKYKASYLPFFPKASHRGTMEKLRLFLDPTELADSQDNCCISLGVLESFIFMQTLGCLNGSDERERAAKLPPPQQHSSVIRNPAVLYKQAGFTIPLPHPLSLYNLYNSSAQWLCQ